MENTSHLEISESALQNNLEFVRKTLCKRSKLSCVVKGNAYGHGIEVFVPLLVKNGVNHISVFSAYEAFQALQSLNVSDTHASPVDVLILGDVPDERLGDVIKAGIEFFVFDQRRLELAAISAKELGMKAKVHLEVETGMNRLGIDPKEFGEVAETLSKNSEWLEPIGICTHFAGAESVANHTRVSKQIRNFKRAVEEFEKLGIEFPIKHSAGSAAALRFPKTRMDMVRIGILTYGFWPSEETRVAFLNAKGLKENPLKRVLSWKSRVMGLKQVKCGDFVGYGTSFLAEEDKKIALIPVGYGNGFARALSNNGRAIVGGRRAPVIGTVNMNAISVDITSFENVKVGDEAILIGKQGQAEISVSSFANFTDQLNYEILARLPKDLERNVVD